MNGITKKEIQFYCKRCRSSYWIDFEVDNSKAISGIVKRSVVHTDHTLILDIDTNGAVRGVQAVDLQFGFMDTFVSDVAQGLHYINSEEGKPVVIDAYTSNQPFTRLIQSIIVEMFKQSTTNRVEDKFRFVATTFEARTTLHANRLHLSVGPYIKSDFEKLKEPYKGIILDIKEAEQNKLDIEKTLEAYDWAAIIVQKEKLEGYYSAFSSMFEKMGTPFFIETLNNTSLKELFDFIFAITLEIQE